MAKQLPILKELSPLKELERVKIRSHEWKRTKGKIIRMSIYRNKQMLLHMLYLFIFIFLFVSFSGLIQSTL